MHKTYIMKCILKSIVTIIVLSVLISCSDRYNVKRTMVEFTKSEIILPDRLTFVKNGECSTINSSELINDNMLIIYVDSTSCSACKISHFLDMLPIYQLADSANLNFSVMAIFSPKIENMNEVELQLKLLDFPYSIYIDQNQKFAKTNNIPSDKRFHDFLISSDGKVKYVGNPLASEDLMSVFLDITSIK